MLDNIRQILFQMLVLAEFKGDKEEFIANFIRQCQKNLSPAYASQGDYYNELQKSAQKSVNEFVNSQTPKLSSAQMRNLRLLAHSFSLL